MNTTRLLHLLAAGDLAAWPDLCRDLERRCDANNAAQALTLLHTQGHVIEAAQWLARVTDTEGLQTLRKALRQHAEGWEQDRLKTLALALTTGDYRLIPAGSFMMGSPLDEPHRDEDEAQHLVEIPKPFLLKTTPVTQAEWYAVMGDNPGLFAGENLPVERVSWIRAMDFCAAQGKKTGTFFTLPSESHWEYACRAGTTGARYGKLDEIAWCGDNTNGTTHPVGQKQPNAWGLYDMLGNVWEWCYDPYHLSPSFLERAHGNPKHAIRSIRGGSFTSYAERMVRAAYRDSQRWDARSPSVGFRPMIDFLRPPAEGFPFYASHL